MPPFDIFDIAFKGLYPHSAMGFPNKSGIFAPFCANLKCHYYNIFIIVCQEDFVETCREIPVMENAFLKTLSDEQKKVFEKFSELQMRSMAYCNDILYRRGFRAGAKMVMEILTEDE